MKIITYLKRFYYKYDVLKLYEYLFSLSINNTDKNF